MAAKKISSCHVRKKERKRAYRCDGCGLVRQLHPGSHWHTCDGMQWKMYDVRTSDMVDAAVQSAIAGLMSERLKTNP